ETCKFHYAGKDVPITISCGYSGFRDNDSTETAFNRADAALYRAKERGRNQCCNADTSNS
ncbi:MAG: diguanylate cyclase, partial [Gammaproteobacteria bacterium]|nr:diguanylate cyclase [Gammaproteobacteria bacterium]